MGHGKGGGSDWTAGGQSYFIGGIASGPTLFLAGLGSRHGQKDFVAQLLTNLKPIFAWSAHRMRTQNRQVVLPTSRPGPGVVGAPGSMGMIPPSLGGASALPATSSAIGDPGRGHNGHALQRSSGSSSAARKSSKSSHRRDDVRSLHNLGSNLAVASTLTLSLYGRVAVASAGRGRGGGGPSSTEATRNPRTATAEPAAMAERRATVGGPVPMS